MHLKTAAIFIESYVAGGSDKIAKLLANSIDCKKLYLFINKSANTEILLQKPLEDHIQVIFYSLPTLFDISVYVNSKKNNQALWYILKSLSLIIRYPLIIFSIIYFYLLFKKYNINLYISNNGGYPGGEYNRSSTLAASLIDNCGVFHIFHSMAHPPRKILKYIEYYYDKLLDSRCHLITDSQVSVDRIKDIRNISQNISIIHNGVKESNLKDYNIHSTLKLLHIGTLDNNKNQLLLLKMMNILINNLNLNIKLYLVGKEAEDGYLVKLQDYIDKYNLKDNITLEGFSQNPYMYYYDMDILLLSSKIESFPTVILEAMSVGLPVITTNAGGVEEQIINNENGYIVNQNDLDDLVNKVKIFYKNRDKIKVFGHCAYEHFNKNFKIKTMIEKYNKLLKKGD